MVNDIIDYEKSYKYFTYNEIYYIFQDKKSK